MGVKITHNRIKPKAKKEPAYLAWLHNVKQPACFVCNIHLGIQIHHVKETSTDERIDSKVIPLCMEHHVGIEFSPHGTPVDFRYVHPKWEQEEAAEKLYFEYKGEEYD